MKAILQEWVSEHPKVSEWIEVKSSKATKFDYTERLHSFCEELKMTPEAFSEMKEKDAKHLILKYYAEHECDEAKTNSTLAAITAARAFWANQHDDHRLNFPRGTFAKPQIDITSHDFLTQDLKAIFAISNVTEKAYISLEVSMGWEISAILDLNRNRVKGLIEQAKQNKQETVFFEDIRHKSGERRLGIINSLAIEWVGKYLEQTKPTEKLFQISQQGLNKVLKRLVKESGIKVSGRIHFHRLRAWHESALFGAGFNGQQVDYIQGHALGAVRATYYKELRQQIEEKYPQVYHATLDISNGNGETKKRVTSLEEENLKLREEIKRLTEEKSKTDDILKILIKKQIAQPQGIQDSEISTKFNDDDDDVKLRKFVEDKTS